jgi:hypothetical protein
MADDDDKDNGHNAEDANEDGGQAAAPTAPWT